MLTFEQILEYLARAVLPADDDNALSDEEASALNAALFAQPEGDQPAGLNPVLELSDEQLTQLAEALATTADAILDREGTPSDMDLATLEFVALASEAITAEQTAREADDETRAQRAQELAQRIRGEAGDGGDGGEGGEPDGGEGAGTEGEGDEGAGGDGAEGGEGEGDGEGAEPQAVAAAASPTGRVAARRPAHARPRPRQSGRATLVASANVPNQTMGAALDDPTRLGLAFADTLDAMGGMALRPGMKIPVATARAQFPEGAMLTMDVRHNERLIQQVTAPEAIVASGGICAPPVPRWDLPQFGTDARPVRDALPRFGSERGGAIIPAPIMLDDLDGAASVWTAAMDLAAATDEDVRKPCLRYVCGDDETVVPYAIPSCLEIGNWNARTWPERVTRFQEKAAQWTARFADSRLLTRIGALSTQVTVGRLLGTTRDVLATLDRAGSQMRNRHRIPRTQPLRFMAPETLLANMRTDLSREMPGATAERLAMADAEIEAFFRARNVNVTWFLDGEAGQVYGAQDDGALNGWKPTVVTYLFPEGTFIFVDGGELNLGIVRDSTLNARNDFQLFSEVWEEVAFVGYESLRLTMSVHPDGATTGTVEPVSGDVASS